MTKNRVFLIVIVFLLLNACSLNKRIALQKEKALNKAPYDVLIIPGYPYKANSHKELFAIRIYWAKDLYDKGITKNIIFSGNAVHSPYYEGKTMRLFAIKLGIPAEHIYTENEALHTNENVTNGKKLAKKLGFENIAYATDPFQFAYMSYIVKMRAPRCPILTFSPDSMAYYAQPLPKVNVQSAFVDNWHDKTK